MEIDDEENEEEDGESKKKRIVLDIIFGRLDMNNSNSEISLLIRDTDNLVNELVELKMEESLFFSLSQHLYGNDSSRSSLSHIGADDGYSSTGEKIKLCRYQFERLREKSLELRLGGSCSHGADRGTHCSICFKSFGKLKGKYAACPYGQEIADFFLHSIKKWKPKNMNKPNPVASNTPNVNEISKHRATMMLDAISDKLQDVDNTLKKCEVDLAKLERKHKVANDSGGDFIDDEVITIKNNFNVVGQEKFIDIFICPTLSLSFICIPKSCTETQRLQIQSQNPGTPVIKIETFRELSFAVAFKLKCVVAWKMKSSVILFERDGKAQLPNTNFFDDASERVSLVATLVAGMIEIPSTIAESYEIISKYWSSRNENGVTVTYDPNIKLHLHETALPRQSKANGKIEGEIHINLMAIDLLGRRDAGFCFSVLNSFCWRNEIKTLFLDGLIFNVASKRYGAKWLQWISFAVSTLPSLTVLKIPTISPQPWCDSELFCEFLRTISGKLPYLIELDISGHQIETEEGISAFLSFLSTSQTLQRINVDCCFVAKPLDLKTQKSLLAISYVSCRGNTLSALSDPSNKPFMLFYQLLMESTTEKHPLEFDYSCCKFTNEKNSAIQIPTRSLTPFAQINLVCLRLNGWGNKIGNEEGVLIAEALVFSLSKLQVLHLAQCDIRSSGAQYLWNAIASHKNLKDVSFNDNPNLCESTQTPFDIVEAVKENKTLQVLSLVNCGLKGSASLDSHLIFFELLINE